MLKHFFCILLISALSVFVLSCAGNMQNAGSAGGASSTASNSTNADSPQKSETPEPRKAESSPAKKTAGDGFETRCGWYENPTPANVWLNDKDGIWVIGIQGGYQAETGKWEANFKDNQWVKTNIHYGYGCACLEVKVNKKEKQIIEIKSGKVRELADCRRDKALDEPKKE